MKAGQILVIANFLLVIIFFNLFDDTLLTLLIKYGLGLMNRY